MTKHVGLISLTEAAIVTGVGPITRVSNVTAAAACVPRSYLLFADRAAMAWISSSPYRK